MCFVFSQYECCKPADLMFSPDAVRMKPRAHNSEDYSSKENGRFLGKLLQHVPALLASGALLMNPLLMDNMAQATTLSPDEQRTVKLFKRNTATVVNITNLGMRYGIKRAINDISQGTVKSIFHSLL